MKVAGKAVSCGFQGDSEPWDQLGNGVTTVSRSRTSDIDGNAVEALESTKSDDNLGVDAVPRDRASLEDELRQLNEQEERLEEEAAMDLRQGMAVLVGRRQERVAKALAVFERRLMAARKVFDYAGEKARETYTSRCLELQKDMKGDMERELRRLQTAKDGVSVTSRRRRGVRDETRAVKPLGNSMRRRRTMYTSDGEEEGPEDVFLASASPEERAQRVEFQEKKRLEQLLGRASVFKPVVQHATAKEIAKDLKTIKSAIAGHEKHLRMIETKSDKKHKIKRRHKPKHERKQTYQKKHTPKRQRPMIITPRRIPHASGPNLPASATPSHRAASTTRRNTQPRLLYNPRMLQEGQEVEVFKRMAADNNADECVMSGIITAATATQVYLLTASGRFVSFDVRDCILGSLYVRAVESDNSPTSCVSNDMNTSSAWN